MDYTDVLDSYGAIIEEDLRGRGGMLRTAPKDVCHVLRLPGAGECRQPACPGLREGRDREDARGAGEGEMGLSL
jgi:hypothetical protein